MVTPWLDELRDPEYFRQVRVIEGGWGVEWPNEQDFSCDTLYLNSRRVRFGARSSTGGDKAISAGKSSLRSKEDKATSGKIK
jgi:hypothetical protein